MALVLSVVVVTDIVAMTDIMPESPRKQEVFSITCSSSGMFSGKFWHSFALSLFFHWRIFS